jgi:predicted MPP superfamily phosphohydrolase
MEIFFKKQLKKNSKVFFIGGNRKIANTPERQKEKIAKPYSKFLEDSPVLLKHNFICIQSWKIFGQIRLSELFLRYALLYFLHNLLRFMLNQPSMEPIRPLSARFTAKFLLMASVIPGWRH